METEKPNFYTWFWSKSDFGPADHDVKLLYMKHYLKMFGLTEELRQAMSDYEVDEEYVRGF